MLRPVSLICNSCVGDKFLADQIKKSGNREKCTYCRSMASTFSLNEVAQRIHQVLEEQFEHTPLYPVTAEENMLAQQQLWERRGDGLEDVIQRVAEVPSGIAVNIRENLSDRYGHIANPHEGEENPYSATAQYEEKETDTADFRHTWRNFRQEIIYEARFFGRETEARLNDIFSNLDSLLTYDGEQVIRTIHPGDTDSFIWRARITYSQNQLREILESPSTEMGPPPSNKARAGRMNADGISVFYGALEESTCISEIRAPVGSHVVSSNFEVIRPIRVLDLAALYEVYSQVSYFDPDYSEQKSRDTFLKELVDDLCRPVMPQDESSEYLATQIVSEYFAHKMKHPIDGMIFPSSQTGGTGRNIVLFRDSCAIEPEERRQGFTRRVLLPEQRPIEHDGKTGEYLRVETEESPQTSGETPVESANIQKAPNLEAAIQQADKANPTLRLNTKSVTVLDVTSVNYSWNPYPVRDVLHLRATGTIEPPTGNVSLTVKNPD